MTSYLGSEIAMLKVKPAQLLESDDIALNLMQDESQHLILTGLPNKFSAKNSWLRDLNTSIANLQSSVKKQDIAIAQVSP